MKHQHEHEREHAKHEPARHTAHAAPARKPKFKLGDKVKVGDREGEIVDVAAHDADWFKADLEQLYCVKCPVLEKADHTHDTLGCVKESEIKA